MSRSLSGHSLDWTMPNGESRSRAAGGPPGVHIDREVAEALEGGRGVVALETAVVTHGLPEPENLAAMDRMDRAVRATGAVPAVCLVAKGKLWIGASRELVAEAGVDPRREKASVRDLGAALAGRRTAGLTVSATLFAAQIVGIQLFATGGIGGVHRGDSADISTDMIQLSRSPVITVCSGAKSILDIPQTLEMLETLGIPVFSYRTEEFPAFYVRSSGQRVPSCDTPEGIAMAALAQWALGYDAGLVVGNPVPDEAAIGEREWEAWLADAELSAELHRISGKQLTPFLLEHVATASEGRTVHSNIALLESNARLAGEIAVALQR